MNPESNSSPLVESLSNTCVKTGHPCALMIQFVGIRMAWCFEWSLLNYAVLRSNPDCRDPEMDPPDELVFFFVAAKVTLLGWRLNSMLDDLACHRIARVWKLSGELAGRNREVAWISEMFVFPADDDVFEEYSSTAAPVTPGTSQLN